MDEFVLPFNILEIELNDNNSRIIYNLKYNEEAYPGDYFYYGDTFYQQFLEKKKEIDYSLKGNYRTEIANMIENDNFIKELCSILESKSISYYFQNISLIGEQCLKEQYEYFMTDIKNSKYQLIKNLIRVKGLCYKIPALTGPSMKIFINPILNFSEYAENNQIQRNNILKSVLILLLVYKVAHFLKFYPVQGKYPDEIPSTKKGTENGKCLIYYLFGQENIKSINNIQANLINNIETWESVEKLKEVFKDENKEAINSKMGELYINFNSNQKEDEYKERKKTDYCFW